MNEPKDTPASMMIGDVAHRFGIPTVLWPRKPLSPAKDAAKGVSKALPKMPKAKPQSKAGRPRTRGEFLSDY